MEGGQAYLIGFRQEFLQASKSYSVNEIRPCPSQLSPESAALSGLWSVSTLGRLCDPRIRRRGLMLGPDGEQTVVRIPELAYVRQAA